MTADRVFVMARSLVSRGVSVIPVPRGQKRPHLQWGEFQQRVASTDEVDRWFSRGEHNLAIILGSVSGLVAVDSDSDEAEEWATHHLPPTPMMTRTSKGRHRFYRHPGVPVRNKVKIHAQGGQIALDVRGDGGYVIGPYSRHPSGHVYEPLGDWTTPLSELPVFDPAWLPQERGEQPPVAPVPAVVRGSAPWTPFARAQAWLSRRDPAVQGHGGDDWTYITACNMVRDFALSDDEAFALLLEWNQRCVPPWTEGELRVKLASARRSGSHAEGSKLMEQRESHSVQRDTAKPTQEERAEEYFQSLVSSLDTDAEPAAAAVDSARPPATAKPMGGSVKPTGIVSSELAEKHIPPMKWAIVDMLPEGYNILSGRPKQRKSFLALQFALAIARGDRIWGRETHQGTVLYLALEDGPRRMQARQKQLLAGRTPPGNLHFFFSWPRWDEGGSAAMEEWLGSHPGDSDGHHRHLGQGRTCQQQEEWRPVQGDVRDPGEPPVPGIQARALHPHDHPQAKAKQGGCWGLPGRRYPDRRPSPAPRTPSWGLKVERGKDTAELEITGRDVPESELSLSWEDSGWQVRSQMELLMQNPLAKAVIDLTMERGEVVREARRPVHGTGAADGGEAPSVMADWTPGDSATQCGALAPPCTMPVSTIGRGTSAGGTRSP